MSLMIVAVCRSEQLTDYIGVVLFHEQPPNSVFGSAIPPRTTGTPKQLVKLRV
jgi:hypothetical protein